jgi:hypothetical protein
MSEMVNAVIDGGKTLESSDPRVSRRAALMLAGATALAGGSGVLAPAGVAQTVSPAFDRLDHVYFLLNIHWLQAGLYSRAVLGRNLDPALLGKPAGTPVEIYPVTSFTEQDYRYYPEFRDFVFQLWRTEIAQIRTLMALANALDGPGKIANLQAPAIWLSQAPDLKDGYSTIFRPLFLSLASQTFSLTTEDHFLVVISYLKDVAVTAYQTVVSAVPNDTTFTAFMAVQAHGAAILREIIFERAQRPASPLFDIQSQVAEARKLPTILPVSTSAGLTTNIVPADNRGRAALSSYATILGQLVGPGQQKSLFFKDDFVGRINTATVNIPG